MRPRTKGIAAVVVWTLATLSPVGTSAQPRVDAGKDVSELSLEELLNVEVTSVARRAQRLSDSAAAVHVIARADIRRSGTTNIPDVLSNRQAVWAPAPRPLKVLFVAIDLTGANGSESRPALLNTIPVPVARTFLGSGSWRY